MLPAPSKLMKVNILGKRGINMKCTANWWSGWQLNGMPAGCQVPRPRCELARRHKKRDHGQTPCVEGGGGPNAHLLLPIGWLFEQQLLTIQDPSTIFSWLGCRSLQRYEARKFDMLRSRELWARRLLWPCIRSYNTAIRHYDDSGAQKTDERL